MEMASASLVCIDYETALVHEDGTTEASLNAYLPNFRSISCAFSWQDSGKIFSDFCIGEAEIRKRLDILQATQVPLLVQNISYEMYVSMYRFPEYKLNWAYDTMRLVQNWDNGGDKYAFETIFIEGDTPDEDEIKKAPLSGLGLVNSLKRVFGSEYVDHKEEAYAWIRANVPESKNKKPGFYLDKLPQDLLRTYNIGDTEQTLRLYNRITQYFSEIGYDWRPDHQLYLSTVRLVNVAKYRGVRVDRELLAGNIKTVSKQIEDISNSFTSTFAVPIAAVEKDKLEAYCLKPKTEKGRLKRRLKAVPGSEIWAEHIKFNEGSNKQLAELFMGKLGIVPRFFTAKGQPSFKSSLLSQWGQGGEMLLMRRKRLIVLKQMEALLELSEWDGRFRPSLRVASTATGRMSGGNH